MAVIQECSGGAAAIGLIQRERPHIVFLDIHMPEVTGFDVLHRSEHVPPSWL